MNATRSAVRSPGEQAPRAAAYAPRPEIPLYRQPGISVSDQWFVVAGRRFAITELSRLRTVRGPHDPLTIRAAVIAGIVLAGIATLLTLANPAGQPVVGTYVAATAATLVPLLMASVGHRLRPRPYELWGEYRGLTIQLFFSDSEREYGQITRALLRAQEMTGVESGHEPSWGYGEPATR